MAFDAFSASRKGREFGRCFVVWVFDWNGHLHSATDLRRVHSQFCFVRYLHALFMVQLRSLCCRNSRWVFFGIIIAQGCHRLAEAFKSLCLTHWSSVLGSHVCPICNVPMFDVKSAKCVLSLLSCCIIHHCCKIRITHTLMINYANDSVGVLDIFVACKIADGSWWVHCILMHFVTEAGGMTNGLSCFVKTITNIDMDKPWFWKGAELYIHHGLSIF